MEDENGNFIEFPQDFWLVPSKLDRRVLGSPGQFDLYSSLKVKVIAGDGYSQCEDVFEIKIWKFSWEWLLLEFTETLGPFIFILTIWNYKYDICKHIFSFNYINLLLIYIYIQMVRYVKDIIIILRKGLLWGKNLEWLYRLCGIV